MLLVLVVHNDRFQILGFHDRTAIQAFAKPPVVSLTVSVPGLPEYELTPIKGTEFSLKGLSGFSIEFKRDGLGARWSKTRLYP